MPNVPNIVRERLRAASSKVNHPDADVLTAFAEQSLPPGERTRVLDHLARCSDCRDVVALALPATEDIGAAVYAPRSGWLAWPALRWALVATGVVVIASFGLLRYRQQPQTAALYRHAVREVEVAKESPVPAALEPEEKRDAPVTASARSEADAKSAAPAEHKQLLDRELASAQPVANQADRLSPQQPSANELHGVVGGPMRRQISNGPNPPVQWQQQKTAQLPQVRMTAPAAPAAANAPQGASAGANAGYGLQTVEVAGGASPVAAEHPDQMSQTQSQDSDLQERSTYSTVGKAKAPVSVETASAAPVIDSAGQQELPRQDGNINGRSFALATTTALLPRWTISSGGGLQRSFDQGSTWQDVDVNANLAATSAGLAALAKSSRAKEKDANKKALKAAAATPTFRVVTALGSEVWAGGSAAALYHSADAGNHWTRVLPSAAGSELSGDIVSLEFSDPQHGRITTSTPEVWTTTDNGQTWQKR